MPSARGAMQSYFLCIQSDEHISEYAQSLQRTRLAWRPRLFPHRNTLPQNFPAPDGHSGTRTLQKLRCNRIIQLHGKNDGNTPARIENAGRRTQRVE